MSTWKPRYADTVRKFINRHQGRVHVHDVVTTRVSGLVITGKYWRSNITIIITSDDVPERRMHCFYGSYTDSEPVPDNLEVYKQVMAWLTKQQARIKNSARNREERKLWKYKQRHGL